MKELDFASLLCSRLCHDLISPVGAISNGLEILSDEDDEVMRGEVIKLLELSARQTSNRLKFFRLAFGAGGGIGALIPIKDAKSDSEALFDGTSIKLVWKSDIGELDKNTIKLLLNLILISSEALIRGGTLMVDINENIDKTIVEVSAKGERIIFQDKIKAIVCKETEYPEIEPKTAPAYIVSMIAELLNTKVDYKNHNENSFTLTARV